MTENSLSAYAPPPVAVPPAGFSIWAPGLALMRHLGLRRKLLALLLCAWLPLLALVLLMNSPALPAPAGELDLLRNLLDGRLGADGVARWAPLGLLAAALLVPLYLAECARRALSEGLDRLRRGALDMAGGTAPVQAQGSGLDELGQALDALGAARDRMTQLREAAGQQADTVARCARELAGAHLAMQLEALEVRSTVGEIARRTVALCGMLDSDLHDVERIGADLDAIHDEDLQTLQSMTALRARLLAVAQHCRALSEAARDSAGGAVDELAAAAGVEIKHCHQLSARVGAERLIEQCIDSMRLTADSLVRRAERGMGEAPQLMVLTRQIEASLATTLQRLEQMTACCASLRALAEAADAARPGTRTAPAPEAA